MFGQQFAAQGDNMMKTRVFSLLLRISVAATLLAVCAPATEEAKVTVLNPRGTPPPIRLVPMATRLDTLDGKTIYVINIGFGDTFLPEVQKVMAEKYPKTTWIFRRKAGRDYFDDDPKLWAEIKEKGHGMIMGIGH
jgi:ABC-type sugar transport system substrate-binding protein